MILNLAQGGAPQKTEVVWVNQDYGKTGTIADFPAQTLTFSGKYKGYYIAFRHYKDYYGSPEYYSIKYIPLTETRIATGYVPTLQDYGGGYYVTVRVIDRVTENSITFGSGGNGDWSKVFESGSHSIPMKIWGVPFAI